MLIADICQMYRQIEISDQDRVFQLILWHFSADQAVEDYQINRVAFGIRSSPFLSLRVIRQLCPDEAHNFSSPLKIDLSDMDINELVTRIDNFHETKTLLVELTKLFYSDGFEMKNGIRFLQILYHLYFQRNILQR